MTQGRVSDADIERLKNAIREARGLRNSFPSPTRWQRRRYFLNAANPPRIAPKTNETARIRMEWRTYRLYQRCGAVLEPPAIDAEQTEVPDNKEEAVTTRPPKKLLEAMLRQAKQLTPEQIEDELDRRELQRLREQATTAKAARTFRENNCSAYRYKLARGEPIISSQFRETFDDYLRPPFANAARRLNLRYTIGARHQPTIDKRTHIWLWPIEDDDGIPLHQLRKEVPPQKKGDRRSARERSRPPLRKHAKADRTRPRKVPQGQGRAQKVPWIYRAPSTPLLVSTGDGLIQDELIVEVEDRA